MIITGAGRGFCSGRIFAPRLVRSDRCRGGPARSLRPCHPGDPFDGPAGHRGRQRCGGRRRFLAGARVRSPHRRAVGDLRPGIRAHRPDPRPGEHLLPPPPDRPGARGGADDARRDGRGRPGASAGDREPGGRGRRPARVASALAGRLAAGPRSIALIKQALDVSAANDLEAQLAVEERLQTEATTTADFVEGVTAFLEKRKAEFTGS